MADKPKLEADEPRLHPVLTNAEVLEIRAKARSDIEKERTAAAKKQYLKEESERLKIEEGLVTGGPADEIVSITINLAEHSDRITINGRSYFHGHTYNVPRHVANTMSEIMARGYVHQSQVEGKSKTRMYENMRRTVLSPVKGVINPPQGAA